MKSLKIAFNITILLLCVYFIIYGDAIYLQKFTFDNISRFNKWKKMILNNEVEYKLISNEENNYVQALSEKACSALYYRIGFNLKEYSILKWKWRVLRFPDTTEAHTEEERDDYAARVYVIFPFLSFSSSQFIEYVWAEDIPVETVIDSPYGNNVKKIVVRSGKMTDGEWVSETRDVYEDYIKVSIKNIVMTNICCSRC